jgi:hypothetical protein
MILLMTVPSLVGKEADATAGRPIGHPGETARRCGELRSAGEARVEQSREVVEHLRRRSVSAQHEVPVRGNVIGEAAILGLPAHDLDAARPEAVASVEASRVFPVADRPATGEARRRMHGFPKRP